MPRAPARIRKRYVEGVTEVLDFELEETLLYGVYRVFGPPSMLRTINCWRRAWDRWRDVVLPLGVPHDEDGLPLESGVVALDQLHAHPFHH